MGAAPAPPPRSTAARVGRVLSLLVGLGCLGYFARQVHAEWGKLVGVTWSAGMLTTFVAAVCVLLAGGLQDAWCWGWLLRNLGLRADSRTAIGVFSVAQFAKYLPGNVAQHLSRLALSRSAGWQLGRVGLSLLIENALAVGSGALFAACGLPGLGAEGLDARLALVATIFLVGMLAGAIVTRALLARPPAFLRRWLHLEQSIELRLTFLFGLLLSHLLSYLAIGIGLSLLLAGAGVSLDRWLWQVPVIVAVGWLSGYLVPGAPAGLGVRELVVTRLLAPRVGVGIALSVALLWRMAALASDLILFLIGLSLRRSAAAAAPKQ